MKPLSLQRLALVAALLAVMLATAVWWLPMTASLPEWMLYLVGGALAIVILVQYIRTGRF